MDRDLIHKPGHITCIVLAVAAFVTACVFNGFAATGAFGLFQNNTGDISNYYKTDITPAGWTFSIWGLIYAWQAAWLIYSLATICRSTAYGYIYANPCHQPPVFYIIYVFNMAANITWLFLWDRFMPVYALIPMVILPLSLYMMLFISYRKCYFVCPILLREGKRFDILLTRALTQNGLAIYATWTTIALLLNIDVVLIYHLDMTMSNGGTICLAVLFLLVVTWFFLDNFVYDRFVRYTLTPYFVFIFALTGSLIENWDKHSSNSILTACLLAVSCLAAVLKLILVIYRWIKHPIFSASRGLYAHQPTYGTLEQGKASPSAPDFDD